MTTVTHSFDRPTPKQVGFAESLARRAGYRYLSDAQKACFGKVRVGGLNRSQMSDLIDWLQAR